MINRSIGSFTNQSASGVFEFALSDVVSSDFAALFDAYQLKAVSMKFVPRITDSEAASNYGTVYYTIDYNDANTFDQAQLMQKQGVQVRRAVGQPWKLYFRPRFASNVYNGSTSPDAYTMGPRNAWISTQNQSVPHYGLKWHMPQVNTATTIDVFVRYYFAFKGVQ